VAAGRNHGLILVCYFVSKQQLLVDTGAEGNVLSASGFDTHKLGPGSPLLAVNGSSINTYGTSTLPLHFISIRYQWTLILVVVTRPLLGAVFLSFNCLLVDIKEKHLVDTAVFNFAMAIRFLRLTLTRFSRPRISMDILFADSPAIAIPNFT
jgi:hypothetical protein